MGLFESAVKFARGDSDEPVKDASQQSEDEKRLVEYIRLKLDEVRGTSSRVINEQTWMNNIAYLLGYSGYTWNVNTRTYQNTDRPRRGFTGRVRVNKILPQIQNRAARLTKEPVKYDIRPESASTEDKDAARLGLDILNDIWDRQNLNLKRIHLSMVFQQSGYGFIHTCWDDTLGKPLIDPITGELEYEGDIRCEVVSPFEVFVDPLAKSMEEAQWVIRAKVRKIDYFRLKYPDKGELVKPEDCWLQSIQYDMRQNTLSGVGFVSDSTSSMMKDSAIEIVYYEKRSKKHPEGRMITHASGVLLEDKELPIGEIAFSKFDDVVIGNRFMGESVITHLRPIQDRYDRLIYKRDQYVAKVLAGKYIAARGHGLSPEALDDQTGEVLEFDPVPGSAPPQQMQIPTIPQYAYTEEDRMDMQLDYISGINQVSRGVLPSASIPAEGMQLLQEADQTRMGIETRQHELAWAEVGRHILKYVSKYYESPRILKLAGGDLQYTVKSFVGADLQNNFDVYVVAGSTSPQSKVLKRQDIMNVYNSGLLPQDPQSKIKVLDSLEFGDTNELWQDYAINRAQVNKQIKQIEEGTVPVRNDNDDHVIHYMEKNQFRKTDKYEALQPRNKQILLDDLQYHLDEMIRLVNPAVPQDLAMADEMQKATSEVFDAHQAQSGGVPPQGPPQPQQPI